MTSVVCGFFLCFAEIPVLSQGVLLPMTDSTHTGQRQTSTLSDPPILRTMDEQKRVKKLSPCLFYFLTNSDSDSLLLKT